MVIIFIMKQQVVVYGRVQGAVASAGEHAHLDLHVHICSPQGKDGVYIPNLTERVVRSTGQVLLGVLGEGGREREEGREREKERERELVVSSSGQVVLEGVAVVAVCVGVSSSGQVVLKVVAAAVGVSVVLVSVVVASNTCVCVCVCVRICVRAVYRCRICCIWGHRTGQCAVVLLLRSHTN